MYRLLPLLLLALCGPTGAALPPAVQGQSLPSLAPMLEQVSPAVVNISTRTRIRSEEHPLLRDPLFRRFFQIPEALDNEDNSLGSGVIIDANKGLLLTNHHVIHRAREIKITLKDGRRLQAELLGSDPETDIALLRIPAKNLSALPLGNAEELRVGDFVVAIGNPFGLSHTVTSGIVSALGRSGLGIEGYENFIQTDASINPGNSGGPLVNLRGELVGLNTAILAPNGGNIGISFAIPVDMAKIVMDQILQHGGVKRGRFGIQVQDLSPDLAQAMGQPQLRGGLVTRVEADSPAQDAGIKAGDVITELNGRKFRNAADLRTRAGLMSIGQEARLIIIRKGKSQTFSVRIAEPRKGFLFGEHIHPYLSGCLLKDILDDSFLGQLAGILVGQVEYASALIQQVSLSPWVHVRFVELIFRRARPAGAHYTDQICLHAIRVGKT
jgi:serine protease DegQ